MAGRLLRVPYGEPATVLLGGLVAEARGGDPLAPMAVVVPSAVAGTTLRRRLAVDAGGLANVAFVSLPQLAESLAAPALAGDGRRPLVPTVARAHVRAALAADPGALAPVATSPATERAVEATVAELVDVPEADLDRLAATGAAARAVVGVTRRFLAATEGAGGAGDVVRQAVVAVEAGTPVAPTVVHLPRRLAVSEVDLLAALARTTDVAVVLGTTGHPEADAAADDLAARLASAFQVALPEAGPPPQPAAPTELVRAPDAAEEVAVAVRLVMAALRGDHGGPALRPERVAIVARVDDPYLPAVHEQLAAAGIPHAARSATTLAQSVVGRTLLGALALPDGDFRRRDVMAWLRGGPVLDPVGGRRVPASQWDRAAREAGVVGGLAQWEQRLARAADLRRQWVGERAAAEGLDVHDELAADRRLSRLDGLAGFVADLAQRLRPPAPATWRDLAAWAEGLVAAYLGPGAGEGWPEPEQQAAESVALVLSRLAQLDDVDGPPDLARFRRALERELEPRARPHGTFGQGVVVGRLADVVGADLDLVVVLGGAEGTLPPRRADDPLVPDRERVALGGSLGRRGLDRGEEHRDLLAVLLAAPRRVLTAPRADTRQQRERQPSPWYLEAATALAGHHVATDEVSALVPHSWFTDVASLEWWLAGGRPAASAAELDLVELLAAHRSGRGALGAAPRTAAETADPSLARGLAAAAARRLGAYDEWSGHVGPADGLLSDIDRPRSPTGLEQYAACPFRFFLRNVLHVGAVDDPTDVDVISALDNGALVHQILELFVREAGVRAPDEPWSGADRQRLLDLAGEVCERYRAEGRTGRDVLWGVRVAQLRHQLLRILDQDEELRQRHGVSPAEVELPFGFDERPPVVVDLGDDRRLAFKGVADRVDRSPDGQRVVVYDYKTGRSDYYRAVDYAGEGAEGPPGDLTARGTKLQLPIYSLAARQRFPEATDVAAYYWFVDESGRASTRGGPYDAAADARFREVVTTVVDGIEAGSFPANPGEETWRSGRWTHGNCTYCDYDRVCPTTRGEQWVEIRRHPRVAGYVRLAEQQPGLDDEATAS